MNISRYLASRRLAWAVPSLLLGIAVAVFIGAQVGADEDPGADTVVTVEGQTAAQLADKLSREAGYRVFVPGEAPSGLSLKSSRVNRIADDTGTSTFSTEALLDYGDALWDAEAGYSKLPTPPEKYVRMTILQLTGDVRIPTGELLVLAGQTDRVNVERSTDAATGINGASYSTRIEGTTVIVDVFGTATLPSDSEILAMFESMLP